MKFNLMMWIHQDFTNGGTMEIFCRRKTVLITRLEFEWSNVILRKKLKVCRSSEKKKRLKKVRHNSLERVVTYFS